MSESLVDENASSSSSSLPSNQMSTEDSQEASSIVLSYEKLTWGCCPPEILTEICQYLDLGSLIQLLLVNKRWNIIVEDFIEGFGTSKGKNEPLIRPLYYPPIQLTPTLYLITRGGIELILVNGRLCCKGYKVMSDAYKQFKLRYQFRDMWKRIVQDGMMNMGTTFLRKSKLCSKNSAINSVLWNSLQFANIEHVQSYAVHGIKKMHIFHDNLIVKSKGRVRYFNIYSGEVNKAFKRSQNVIDFHENEYVIVEFVQRTEDRRVLNLFGKVLRLDSQLEIRQLNFAENVLLFKLEDQYIIIVTDRYIVLAAIWRGNTWTVRLVGRLYGSLYNSLYAIHLHNETVFVITKFGTVYRENKDNQSFEKITNYNVAASKHPTNWLMFQVCDVVVSVDVESESLSNCVLRTDGMRLDVTHSPHHILIEALNMTCALEHGETLFLGFSNGIVLICRPNIMKLKEDERKESELMLRLSNYDNDIQDPAIVAIDVYEIKLSHYVFVATKHKVFQFLITHPDIAAHYESKS